jgi:putative ABC transport system substrate-binding protein
MSVPSDQMKRRNFIAGLLTAVLAPPLAGTAKDQAGVAHLGVLWPFDEKRVLDAFREELLHLGWIEGENIVIVYRSSHGNDSLLPMLAAELASLNVNVILTWGVTAARAVKQATTSIPIVNGSMSDPVRAKLVDSLARPGGNLTGITSATPVLSAKRLELLKELVPGLARVTALATPAPTALFGLQETRAAAQFLGIDVRAKVIKHADQLDEAFASAVSDHAQAVIVLPDLMFDQNKTRLIGLSAAHRLPTIYYARWYVEAGGLASYASSFVAQFKRAATMVDKILKGIKPSDLPVEQVIRFELIINASTAKILGLSIPSAVLARADEVIE